MWQSTGTGFVPQSAGNFETLGLDPNWGPTWGFGGEGALAHAFAVDYDHDGREDLAIPAGRGVLRGMPDGTLQWLPNLFGARPSLRADVDGDGDPELVGLPDRATGNHELADTAGQCD